MSQRTTIAAFEDEFRKTKAACEGAMRQLDESQLHAQINPRQKSVAVIVQHLHRNMLARFPNFLTSGSETPTCNREREFAQCMFSRDALIAHWEEGWRCVFAALAPLTDEDLARTILIRNESRSVAQAITRQVTHYSWLGGQIALISKHLLGERWNYLTVPPGGSAAFNQEMGMK